MEVMEPVCAVCGTKAPHRCASCQSISYCSAEHQKDHWKGHRKVCPHFRIVEDQILGKGFLATRDIKPGTVILEEEPVAVSPLESPMLSCLTCGLDNQRMMLFGRRCSRCKWPVCSLECENHPMHAENECRIFASRRIIYSPVAMSFFEDHFMGVRVCLLKKNDPQLYQEVLELCPEYSLPNEGVTVPLELDLMEILADVQGLDLDSGEVAKLLRIFRINCLSGTRQDMSTRSNPGSSRGINVLYLKSSRMNHSCIPNCHWEVGPKPEFKIRIRTTCAVKKGELLTIFYWPEHITKPTEVRQEIIRENGNFRCKCARCTDPTELGTYRSGVVCKACRKKRTKGYFLPQDPLNFSPDARWECCCCRKIKMARDVLPAVEEIWRRIFCMEMLNELVHIDWVNCYKYLVEETSGVILHPNHWIIQKVLAIVRETFMCHPIAFLRLGLIEYAVTCMKHLLSIMDVLTPGITQRRATAQVHLAIALHLQCVELLSRRMYDHAEQNYEECLVLLNEALKFCKDDFPTADGVVQSVRSIEKIISQVLLDRSILQLKKLKVSGFK
ncbi:unnamed protein product, partial [Allacma fusca]